MKIWLEKYIEKKNTNLVFKENNQILFNIFLLIIELNWIEFGGEQCK